MTLGNLAATTDASGRYSVTLSAPTNFSAFDVSGVGLLTRRGFFTAPAARTLDLDAFSLTGFDSSYFRAVAHNGHEAPTALQPLRRWTRAPMVYLRTIDDSGRAILPEVLQQVVTIVSSVVPQYSNGRFGVAGIEQGTDTRVGQSGWVTINWVRDLTTFCGRAHVGLEGGVVDLVYDQGGCACGSQKIRPRTVKHEFGHVLGLWHSGQSQDLMSGLPAGECDRNISPRELEYLDYLYRRPVGNLDPDTAPATAAPLESLMVVN